MELVTEKRLDNGEILQVWHWRAPEPLPEKYLNYVVASFTLLHPEQNYFAPGWIAYITASAAGKFYPEVHDHWFFAEINGECAGRLWFAYSARTHHGNFGNVKTEEKFRRRGIMTELMKCFITEFQRSSARMLACATGNVIAAATYKKFGFEVIYGGETGPMCVSKDGKFLELDARLFSDRAVTIRPATRGDQFDADKLLAYSPGALNRRKIFPERCGAAMLFPELRLILQEIDLGNGKAMVAVNSLGAVVAYAFVMVANDTPTIDFTYHSAFAEFIPKLLRRTLSAYFAENSDTVFLTCCADDAEKRQIAENSSAKLQAIVPNMVNSYALHDAAIYTFSSPNC